MGSWADCFDKKRIKGKKIKAFDEADHVPQTAELEKTKTKK